MQEIFDAFKPAAEWAPTPVSQLPSWRDAKRICIDVETRDDNLRKLGPGVRRGDGYIVGYGVAIEDGPAFYLPTRHQGGGNLDADEVRRYLMGNLREYRGQIAGAGLPYDIDYMQEEGFPMLDLDRDYRDCQVAEPLLDELQMRYGLDAICERRGIPGKDERKLQAIADAYRVEAKGNLWRFHSKYVGEYVLQDLRAPLQLLRRQERELEDQDLWGVYQLESALLPALVSMRRRGVRIDVEHLSRMETWALAVEAEMVELIRQRTGHNIGINNCMKKKILVPMLETIGFKCPVKVGPKTGKPDVVLTAAMLRRAKHEVTSALLRAREFFKLRTTFCASIRRFMVNGRIHCTFNQLRTSKEDSNSDDDEEADDEGEGGRFGRISCKDPNLQQQPIRHDEFGKAWRCIYLPEEGHDWAKLDYSQQEPRTIVHYAVLKNLAKAKEFAHAYNTDPTTDFHNMTSQISGLPRKQAKNLGLGCAYGMGEAKLCRELGLPTVKKMTARGEREVAGPEGKAVMEKFHANVPFIKALSYLCQDRVKEVGFIRTIGGRRCRFPKDEHGNPDWLHKALNRLIQGSGADETKAAVVALYRAGFLLHLQVHDEVDLSVTSLRAVREAKETMESVVPKKVRNLAEADVGPSWGKAETVPVEQLLAA